MTPARTGLLVVLVLVLAWRAAPGAGFFWDDDTLVLANRALDHWSWREVLFRDLWYGTPDADLTPYWRPLMVASLHLDRALFGVSPAGAHVHNLVWHLAAAVALYVLALPRIGAGRAAAAALLFGVHPIQSEAVLWVAARNDLMSAAFLFACLGAVDRGRTALAAGAACLAAMSKEVGFLAPVYAVFWGLAWGKVDRRGVAGAAIGAAVALALRSGAHLGVTPLNGLDPLTLASAPGKVVASLLGWLVWPWPLTSTMSLRAAPPSLWRWATALVAGLGLFWTWRAAPRRGGLLLACALLAWAPTLLAVATTFYVGERFLYLPLAFLAVAVAAAVPATPVVLGGAAVATAAAFVALTVRVPEWRSEMDLWQAAARRAPDTLSYAQLARAHERAGELREAFHAWMAASAQEPRLAAACEGPLRLLVFSGAVEQAATLSDDLVARGCAEEEFAGWRGVALLAAGRVDDARAAMAGGPWRHDDVPIVAAVCEAEGDLDCVAGWALRWGEGPSALRAVVHDLVAVHVPSAPG